MPPLAKAYPQFLALAPRSSAPIAFELLNNLILRDRLGRYLGPEARLDDLTEPFEFHGQPTMYLPDMGALWGLLAR